MRKLNMRRLEQAERGQSLVELALSLSILIVMVSGLLDLGRVWYIYVAMEDAAAEAALYLSIDPYCDTPDRPPRLGVECGDPFNAQYRAENSIGNDIIDWTRATINVIVPSNPLDPSDTYGNVGEIVTVEISYPIDLLTPVMPKIAGVNPLTLTARASQTVISEREDDAGLGTGT